MPDKDGSAFPIRKPDHGTRQITNCQNELDSTQPMQGLDVAASSRMDQRNTAVQTTTLAAHAALAATARAHSSTARDPDTTVRSPQATARASCATTALSCATVDRSGLNTQSSACQFKESTSRSVDGHVCSTAFAALLPSAMDMDDHFRRWQCIARQKQSIGSSAYPPLPSWAARIAPYPACELMAGPKQNRTRYG